MEYLRAAKFPQERVTFIKNKKKASFAEVFEKCENKIHAVFIFLSMLELIQLQIISIIIGEGNNNFWLTADIAE